MEAKELLQRYAAGKRAFEDIDLQGVDLSGANLISINLTGANLTHANLNGTVLSLAKLIATNLEGAQLQGAKLMGADLTGAQLKSANLSETNLMSAKLIGANLVNTNLSRATLMGADLQLADLRRSDLTESDFSKACLEEADLTQANVTGIKLNGANLTDAVLPESLKRHNLPPVLSPVAVSAPPRAETEEPPPSHSEVMGDYQENLPSPREHLTMSLSLNSSDSSQCWQNIGLTAEFLANYFTTFLTGDRAGDVRYALNFVINELLENAAKYGDKAQSASSLLRVRLYEDKIIFAITHRVDAANLTKLRNFIRKLQTYDPFELYARQVEKNANNASFTRSGLGLLTAINDYGVKLGWKFEPAAERPGSYSLTTMIQFAI